MKIYTVSDDQMNGYCGPLFEAASDNEALVQIRRTALHPDSVTLRMILPFQKLICIGDFDRDTGVLTCERRTVCNLSSLNLPEVDHENSSAL